MIVTVTNKQQRQAMITLAIGLLLGIFVKLNFFIPVSLDKVVHGWFSHLQSGLGDILMTVSTFLSNPIVDVVYVLILAGVLILAQLRIPAIWSVLTIILGDIIIKLLQLFVSRTRPSGHLLTETSPAFPSAHIFGIFVVIFILNILVIPNINHLLAQIILEWAIVMIALMAIMSRIYFNANFLSDTIASILFAYAWVIFAASMYGKVAHFLRSRFVPLEDDEI